MGQQPLQGKRIVVTRAEEQASDLVERLRALGAEALVCPMIAIAPPLDVTVLDAAIEQLETYDWLVITSANGVRAFFERFRSLGRAWPEGDRIRIAVVGPATAKALARAGQRADFMPSTHTAEALLAELMDVAGRRVLLPCGDLASPALADGLRERGAQVDSIIAYRTVPGPGVAALASALTEQSVDIITFTSSSTVRYALVGLEQAGIQRAVAQKLLLSARISCIGPVTAETVRQEGLRVDAVAREHTTEGLVEALTWLAAEL